jgi:hypothetical protein
MSIPTGFASRQCRADNIVQSTSCGAGEEAIFDGRNVISVDGRAILPRHDGGPELIDIILTDHPNIRATGAGEPASRPMAAATVKWGDAPA